MEFVAGLGSVIGVEQACEVLAVPRASFYRWRNAKPGARIRTARPIPARRLTDDERRQVRDLLYSERFVDMAPRAIWAVLLDEETCICHWRTFYRILEIDGEVRERRNQRNHPTHPRPELVATAPNQLWSWDITKLRGSRKGVFYHLYLILDVFSRYAVGWTVAEQQSERIAKALIEDACEKQGVAPGVLTLHADRGGPMIAKSVTDLLIDLEVTRSHSRPRCSNDNAYSESQFKTMKYHPSFPDRFTGGLDDARQFCRRFIPWYNEEHRHSGIALLTPSMVHHGLAPAVLATRRMVLEAAYAEHPLRFPNGPPRLPQLPSAVWINRPETLN